MADVIGNTIPTPIQIYGRAPNGQLQAVTTDGSGNISFAGAGGSPTFPVNSQTISYAAVAGDFSSSKLITMSSASATTLTLLAVAPASGQNIHVENIGTATVTIANNTRNIDGAAANFTLLANQGVLITSDGTNYFTNRGGASSVAITPTSNQVVKAPSGNASGTFFVQDASALDTNWLVAQSNSGVSLISIGSAGGGQLRVAVKNLDLIEQGTPGTAFANESYFWADSTTHTITFNENTNGVMSFSGAWVNTNLSPVTVAANVATDQNLMSASVPAGTLNRVGRSLRIWCAGIFSTPAAETTTITFKVKFGSLTLINIVVPSQSFTATNNQFNISGMLSVQTAGATGVFEPHGNLVVDLGIGNLVSDSTFADINTAVSSTVDLTAAQTLQVTVAYGTASASNSTTQRQMVLETVG